MGNFFSKNISTLRFILGLCSLINVIFIAIYGVIFLEPQGPLPESLALLLRNPSFLNFLPLELVNILPYWWSAHPFLSLILHAVVLISFMFGFKPKITTLLLFVFEYCLVVRMGLLVHGGHLLFLNMLLFFVVEDWVSEDKKWLRGAFWVSQFSLVYFFSGIYKNFDLWFWKGEALQKFINLESANNGIIPPELGSFGLWLSRIVIPVEVLAALALMIFFLLKRIPRIPALICALLLMGVHLGSWVFFSIFTFPLIGIMIVYGIYLGLKESEQKPLKWKASILLVFFLLHFLPYLKISFFPLNTLPFRNQWTFFSQPPGKVVGGEMKLEVSAADKVVYATRLNDSFHWTRYRFILDKAFPNHVNHRLVLNQYLCRQFQGEEIRWKMPEGKESYFCEK